MNNQRRVFILFILMGTSTILLMLFPKFLSGADAKFVPVQGCLLAAGLGVAILGFDLAKSTASALNLFSFIKRQSCTYIPWIVGGLFYASIAFLSPNFSTIQRDQE